MKQLKFAGQYPYRIWCSLDKEMLYSYEDVEAFANKNGETIEAVKNCEFSDLFAHRSTRLKDKNGKEIYEGDVLEFEEPRFESDVIKCAVEFLEAGYVCIDKNTTPIESTEYLIGGHPAYRFYELDDMHQPEIVGNIYKNPELIENNEK